MTTYEDDIRAIEALKAAKIGGETVEATRAAVIAKVGENVQLRRMARIDGDNTIAAYVHGGRIGVLIEVKGGTGKSKVLALALPFLLLQTLDLLHPLALLCVTTLLQLGSALS